MADEQVKVECHHPQGLHLRLFKLADNPMDHTTAIGAVILKFGQNLVDKEFMDQWIFQNRDNDLMTSGVVSIIEEPVKHD